ncbi:MAG TPA: ADP-ribosylglycohydrolase family protein [Feifaniaceae bacterium]|nr:ADP-ribosylglycohydrolase family protein [Feifaniaceae bacterium]
MVNLEKVQSVFTALAVGDAVGMPTEFMTRSEITAQFSALVPGLINPIQSHNHANLPFASVTDDTEQNLYLYRLYQKTGRVDARETADCLLLWAEETNAEQKRYIGPSSLAALRAIRAGTSVEEAGKTGTTCGGIMRSPAAVLWQNHASSDELARDIYHCLQSTHHTSEALEAAGAYGFALQAALGGASRKEILSEAVRGGSRLVSFAPSINCAPSSAARIKAMYSLAATHTPEHLLDELYGIYGTGLPSADVCGAVFAIFFSAKADVWQAIRMGASVGGDTDTIASLAGALCCAYAGGHNIPDSVVGSVFAHNPILVGTPWEAAI